MTTLPPVQAPLAEDEAEAAFGALLDGKPGDGEVARFLIELSDRGEVAAEIAGEQQVPTWAPTMSGAAAA